jgi:uncharacterized protein (TIGR02453 family)
MKATLQFLNELQQHNQRDWFEANKPRFKVLYAQFHQFVENLIVGISLFDESVKNVTTKESIYRIYRDIRFSPNKLPYKCHFAAYICPGGKKSGYSGYYFHVEAKEENYIGRHLLAAGAYCPESIVLQSIREDIEFNGQMYREALQKAPEFTFMETPKLIKVPAGFDKNSPFADLLRVKDFSIAREMTEEELFSPCLLEWTLEHFRTVKPYNDLLNKAIAYAYETRDL